MVNTGFKKVICTGVAIAFIVTSVFSSGNLSAQPIQTSLPLVNIDVNKIIVNSGVAFLEERFTSPEGPKGRTVIAIQNAHGIFDAQENIRALIQELQDKYNFSLVGLEGGAGKSDHTFLRTFPDKEVNRKVAESYMRRAELSGGEAAAILNPKPGIFYGVETPELYYINRNSFLKAQGLKDANLHAINLFQKKLDKQREKIFPPELLAFHKAEQKYLSGQMPLWEFIDILGGFNLSEQYPGVLAIYAAIAKARQAGQKAAEAKQAEEAAAKVEGRVLFEEIKNLSRNIEDHLSFRRRPESRSIQELLAQYHELRILKNLVSLEMTRAEYEEYLKLDSGLRRNDNLKELNLTPALQFYADAVKRDHAMYDNLMRDMKKEKQNISIIVAGGFHTSGFAERMKKEGVSFAVYSPRIHDMPKENKYLDVMEGKASYVSTIESPLPTMGLNKDGEAFVDNYAKTEIRLKQQAGANLSELKRNWRDDIIRAEKNKSALADPSPMIQRLEKIFRTFLSRASQILEELKNNYLSIAGAQAKNKVGEFVESERKRLEAVKPVETIKAASLGKREQLLEEVAEISKAIKGFPVEHQLEFSNLFEKMAAKPGYRDLLKNLQVLSMGSGGIRHAEKIMLDAGVGRLDSVGILQEAINRRYQRSDFLADYEQLSGRKNYGHYDMPYDQYLNVASPESVDIALTFAGIEVHGVPQELLQNGKSAEDILFETYRGLYSVLKPGGIILNFGYISRDLFPGDLKQKVEALGFDIQISGYKNSIVVLRKKKSETHPSVLTKLPSAPTAPEAAKGASLGFGTLDEVMGPSEDVVPMTSALTQKALAVFKDAFRKENLPRELKDQFEKDYLEKKYKGPRYVGYDMNSWIVDLKTGSNSGRLYIDVFPQDDTASLVFNFEGVQSQSFSMRLNDKDMESNIRGRIQMFFDHFIPGRQFQLFPEAPVPEPAEPHAYEEQVRAASLGSSKQDFLNDLVEKVKTASFSPTRDEEKFADLIEQAVEKPEFREAVKSLNVLALGSGGIRYAEGTFLEAGVGRLNSVGILRQDNRYGEKDFFEGGLGGEFAGRENYEHHESSYSEYLSTQKPGSVDFAFTFAGLEKNAIPEELLLRGAIDPEDYLLQTYRELYSVLAPGGMLINFGFGPKDILPPGLKVKVEELGFKIETAGWSNNIFILRKPAEEVRAASLGASVFFSETEVISPAEAERLADDGSTAGAEFSRNRTALASRFARRIYEEYLKQSGREGEIAALPSAIILRENKLTYSLGRILLHSYENAVDSYLERKRKTETAAKKPFTENLEIVYRLSRDGDFIVLEILDNGIGEVDKAKTFMKGYQSYPRYIGGQGMADRDIMENIWAMRANKRLMNRTDGPGAVLEIKIPTKTIEDYLGQAMGKSLGGMRPADLETSKKLAASVLEALRDPEQKIRALSIYLPAEERQIGRKWEKFLDNDTKEFMISKLSAEGKPEGMITHLALNKYGEAYAMQIEAKHLGKKQKGGAKFINPQHSAALLPPILDALEQKNAEGKISKFDEMNWMGQPLDKFLPDFRAKILPPAAPAILPSLPPIVAPETSQGASLGLANLKQKFPKFAPAFDHPDFVSVYSTLENSAIGSRRLEKYFSELVMQFAILFQSMKPETARKILKYIQPDGSLDLNRLIEDTGITPVYERSGFAADNAISQLTKQLGLSSLHYEIVSSARSAKGRNDRIIFAFEDVTAPRFVQNEKIYLPLEPFKYVKRGLVVAAERRGAKRLLGLDPARTVIVVSSPSDQQVRQTLDAYKKYEKGKRPLMILGLPQAQTLMAGNIQKEYGFNTVSRTDKTAPRSNLGGYEVVVLNTSGELVDFMRAADVVIVGSNRNVFEPVSLGIPTLYFAGVWSANEIGRDVTTRAGAAKPVDLENFKPQMDSILKDPHPMTSAAGNAVRDFDEDVIPAGRLYGSLATAAAILDRASGRSLGAKPRREEAGEDEVYALAPEDYWKDPVFRGQFFEKPLSVSVLLSELERRGVQVKTDPQIPRLLDKIRFYQMGRESELEPYQLDVLAALLTRDPKTKQYRIFTVLEKKGISPEKIKSINLQSVSLLTQVDVGRRKGQNRDVVRVMVEAEGVEPYDFAAAVDRKQIPETLGSKFKQKILGRFDEFYGMKDFPTYAEYEALQTDSQKTDLLPRPYLLTRHNGRLILFKEYFPGIDLEDWFGRIRQNIVKKNKSVPARLIEQVMYKIGRMFGEYYVKTRQWPGDMHFGNIIINAGKDKKITLNIADYSGGSRDYQDVALGFEQLIEFAARGALYQFEESDFPTEDPRFLMYLLAGFESAFSKEDDALTFFIRIMPDMNRAPDAYARRMLDRFLMRNDRILIDPFWGTGPVKAASLGAPQKTPDDLTPADIPELIQALAIPHALTVYSVRAKLFKSGPAAIPYLLKAMEDENPSIRQGAVYATVVILSGLKEDPENMSEIINRISAVAAQDSNSRVREIAWKALDQLSLVYSNLIPIGIRLRVKSRRFFKNLQIPFSWKALKESFSPSFVEAIQKRFVVSRTLKRVLVTNPDGLFERSVREALTRFLLLLNEKTRAGFISAISNKGGRGTAEILLNLIPETQTADGMEVVLGGLGKSNVKQFFPELFQALPEAKQKKIQSSVARFMEPMMADAQKTIENPALTRELVAKKEILLAALRSAFVIRGEPEMGRTMIRDYAQKKGKDWAALTRDERRSMAREFYFDQMRLVADLMVQMKEFISENPDADYETIKAAILDPVKDRLTPTQRFRFTAGILNYIHQHLRIENIRKAAAKAGVESGIQYSGSNLEEPQKAFFEKLMGFVPETATVHFYPDYLYIQLDDDAYVHFLYLVDDDVVFRGGPDQFKEMPVFEQALYAQGFAVNAFGDVLEFNGLPLPSFGLESKTGGETQGTKTMIRHERQHHFFLLYGGEELENYYSLSPRSDLPLEDRLLKPILLNAQNEMIARITDGRAFDMDGEEAQKWFDRYWSSQFIETVRDLLEEIPASPQKTEMLSRVRERAQEITRQGFEKIRQLLRAKYEELKTDQPGLNSDQLREKSEEWTAAYLQTLPLTKIERLTELMEGLPTPEEVSGASLGKPTFKQLAAEKLRKISIGELREQDPEFYQKALDYFGGESGFRLFADRVSRKVQDKLKYQNPEAITRLLDKLKNSDERWIIAIDGLQGSGSGKSTLWNAIQNKEMPLGELFEEMEFLEGEVQIHDWRERIWTDPEVSKDDDVRLGYMRQINRHHFDYWISRLAEKYPRPLGMTGDVKQQINLILRGKDTYTTTADLMRLVPDRIIVYGANQSHMLMDLVVAKQKDFPYFNVAKVTVAQVPGTSERRLDIFYTTVGSKLPAEISDARKRQLEPVVDDLTMRLATMVPAKIQDFEITENDVLDQLQALRAERKLKNSATFQNQIDMEIMEAFKKSRLTGNKYTDQEAEYVVAMAAKNFRDVQGRSLGNSALKDMLKYDGWVRAGYRDLFQRAVGEGALTLQASNMKKLQQLILDQNTKYKNVLGIMNILVLGSGAYPFAEEILLNAGAGKIVSVGIRRDSSGYAERKLFDEWAKAYQPGANFTDVDEVYENYLVTVPDNSIDLVMTYGGLEKAGILKELMLRAPPKSHMQYLKEIYALLYQKLSPGAIIINYGYGGTPEGDKSGDDNVIPAALRPDLEKMGYEIQTSNQGLTVVLRKPETAAVGASLGIYIANAGNLAREELTNRLGPELLEAMKEANGGRPVVPLYFSGTYEDILMGDKEPDAPSLRRMLSRVPDSEMTALIIDSKFGARTDHIILIDTAKNFKDALPMMDFYLRGQETWPVGGFKFKSNLGIEQFEFVFHASAFQENSALGRKAVHMNVISLGKEKFLPLRRQGLMSEAVSSMGDELAMRYANWPVSTEARNAAVVHWFEEYAVDSRFAVSDEDFESVKPFITADSARVRRAVESYQNTSASRKPSAIIYDGLPMIGKIPEYLLAINFADLASAPRPFWGMDVEAMAREVAEKSGEGAAASRWDALVRTAEAWQFNPNKITDEEIEALKLGFKLLIHDAEGGDFTTGDIGHMARARIMTRTYMRGLVGDKPQTAEVLREAKKLFLNSGLYLEHRREKEIVGTLTQADVFLTLARESNDIEMAKNVKNELELITAEELKKFHSAIARSYLKQNERLEEFGLSLSLIAIAQSKIGPLIKDIKKEPKTGLSSAKGASLGAAPLEDDEVRYLAFKLGFGLFTGNQDNVEKKLAQKISLANIDAVGDQVYQHILAELPEYFEKGTEVLEDLIGAVQKATDQELARKIEIALNQILNSMSDPVKASLKPQLIKSFIAALREVSKRVTLTEADMTQAGEARKLYQSAVLSEGEAKMRTAETLLLKRLREATSRLMKPNEKTVIVTHPLSLPKTREEIAGMFQSAFAAAPNDALLGRPLLHIYVYVTDENGNAVRDYVEELKKSKSPYAANVEVKRAAPADLARVFEGHEKRAKTENLIFLLPAAKLAARESRVIQHEDSSVPEDLAFVKDALAEAAVGLARALKLPEGNREREDYLTFLQSELGISWKQDPESRRIIISLDLKAFVENLVEIARAQRATAIAA